MHELSCRREMRVVDVRASEERGPPLGYVPGSRHLSEHLARSLPSRLWFGVPADTPIAICCMSGRRGRTLTRHLRALGHPNVFNVEGGVLGWSAAGLPLAGAREPSAPSLRMDVVACRRALRSSFAVVCVEGELDRDTQRELPDPRGLFDALYAAQRARGLHEAQALEVVLFGVAELAWRQGYALDRVAWLTDHGHDLLCTLAA